ncbi:transposase [Myroides indicus]|uniref:Uncharacterized protein n=1 Tax=Myroides indicus TaxID=1323422 RepID=A0A4R7EUT4_9FLAO|nr:transposase [Myroides indicus]TDS56856.1 hypothetical protein C8P70_1184 [Myroides indicus]
MKFNYKHIHIGELLRNKVEEKEIERDRILKFLKIKDPQLRMIYESKNIDTDLLLRFSKLLEYDFFRIFSHHILLYAPPSSINYVKQDKPQKSTPKFRKNLYTTEIIEFIMELVEKGEMKNSEIINKYNIPKTTLYKWIKKHKK